MLGFFQRLLGVQELDPAIKECEDKIEEIEDLSELTLLCSLYTLNYNESDGEEIKRILLKYSLTDYTYDGTIFNVVNEELIVKPYIPYEGEELPPSLQKQAH